MATEPEPIEDWGTLPWRKLERAVYRLQTRIYRASLRGNEAAVHSLQRLLMKSEAARCVAVRRVTQENQGKRTAGVDGVKSVRPAHRLLLVARLREAGRIRPRPTRRVWILKPGKVAKRPLGIPTMLDRAHQTLAKLALEPEWEAKFEPNSYGFRPGRSAQDAIAAIFNMVHAQPKYVLDADIAACFDRIAHAPLLAKLHTFPVLRRAIRAWLKAGVLENGGFMPTPAGTPQGGCISPLLANVALHGMEAAIQAGYTGKDRLHLVRYADDLVVLCRTQEGVEHAWACLQQWLAEMGLELKPSKTRITHTLQAKKGDLPGFDFLGFNIRQYPVGRYRSGRRRNGRPFGFKTLIRPSREAVRRHRAALRHVVRGDQGLAQQALIGRLNLLIRGWTHYYRSVAASTVFNDCDNALFPLLLRWAKRRHARKNAQWVVRKYWRTIGQDHWCFATPKGHRLLNHASIHFRRHIKVRGRASPFDGQLVYWARRLRDHPLAGGKLGKLLFRQQSRCGMCGLYFHDEDQIEIDHILPRHLGGTDDLWNLWALHRHCHDQRHAASPAGGIPVKNSTTEELDEEKILTSSFEGGRGGAILLA